jgi:hypothetical protein
MSTTHINHLGPAYDVTDGQRSLFHDGYVQINSDDSRLVTFKGKWRLESWVANNSFVRPMGAEQPANLFTQPSFTQMFNGMVGTTALKRDIPSQAFAMPSTPDWTEPSTCRGILRAITEAAQKLPPSKPILDAVEIAKIALLDYHKALGETKQGSWHASYLLSGARNTLVHEVYNASLAKVPFSQVSAPCQLALDATQAAIAAIEKAEAST